MKIDYLAKGLGLDSFELLGTIEGGNSFVHKILHEGKIYALKHYKGTPERQSRSLNYESTALHYLNAEKIIRCPELLGCNLQNPSILYRWIEGDSDVETNKVKDTILNSISKLSESKFVQKYTLNAIDSVLDSGDLINQLNIRFDTFSNIPSLPIQLYKDIKGTYDYIKMRFPPRTIYNSRLLSLSDYGPHNLIKNEDRSYTHIDFEFFGIDSHVKVYSDIICHPKSLFSSNEIKEIIGTSRASKDLESEIFSILPAIALKWVFIVLKRYINWNSMEYMSSVSGFSNPSSYLAYTKHLLGLQKFNEVITYREFENL
jgi:hypothetical protein